MEYEFMNRSNCLFRHVETGNLYIFLSEVMIKNDSTREWMKGVQYTSVNGGTPYCRTEADFKERFELVLAVKVETVKKG